MELKPNEWKDFHHMMYQIYHGIIALTLVPFALLFLEWDSSANKVEGFSSSPSFIILAQLIWIIAYASWYVWKGEKVMYRIDDNSSISEKMREFKKRSLLKYGILAVAGLLAAGAMWIKPSFVFVISYFAILIQYSFLRPSEDKFVRELRVTKEEREMMHSN
ncbi:hypothetical protein [Ekhidna sp.]